MLTSTAPVELVIARWLFIFSSVLLGAKLITFGEFYKTTRLWAMVTCLVGLATLTSVEVRWVNGKIHSLRAMTAKPILTKTDLDEAKKDIESAIAKTQDKPYEFVTDGARIIPRVAYATPIEFCTGCCASFGNSITFGLNVDLSSTGRLAAMNLRHLTKVFISDHLLSYTEETAHAEEAKVEFKKQVPISVIPHNTILQGETVKFFTICDARFTQALETSFRSGTSLIYLRMLLVYRDMSMPASKVGVTESWGWYKRNFLASNLCHNHNRSILLSSDLSDL